MEEAAAEAYKSAEARPYGDDDDDYLGPASHHTGFSNETHGTYGQPPLSHGEAYGMTDLSPPMGGYGGHAGYPDNSGASYASAGAAGLGAGTGLAAMQRQKSMRDAHVTPSAPHHAFAGPSEGAEWDPYGNINTPYMTTQQQQQQHAGYPPYPRNDADLLAAAGLGDHMSGAAATSLAHHPSRRSAAQAAQQRGMSLSRSPSHVATVQHPGAEGLQRNRSMSLEADYIDPAQVQPQQAVVSHTGSPSTSGGGSPPATQAKRQSMVQESYASHYAPPAEDPYGGYVPATGPAARSQDSHGDRRRSRYTSSHYSDGDDDERADSPEPRVLRIANQ